MKRIENRVLILDLSERYGGASERAIGMLAHFPEGRAALGSLQGSPVAERARKLGFEVYCVGSRKFDLRIGPRLVQLVRDDGFQVIDSQNPQSRFWAGYARQRTRAAHVASLNSWPRNEYGKTARGAVYGMMDRVLDRKTDLYVVVSQEIEAALRRSGIDAERLELIPNAVAVEPSAIAHGVPLRRAHGIPAGVPLCCAIGRLTEVKGFKFLIEAVHRLEQHGTELYCLIVGSGELYSCLMEQVRRRGLSEHIRLLGDQDHSDVMRIVQASDFFVMPSLSEGTPLALLEAAALGRPIVASQVGGIPDIISHHRTGLLVVPADVADLEQAMAWVCKYPEDAARLGNRVQQEVSDHFAMRPMLEAVENAYRKAIAVRSAGPDGHVSRDRPKYSV